MVRFETGCDEISEIVSIQVFLTIGEPVQQEKVNDFIFPVGGRRKVLAIGPKRPQIQFAQ